MFFGNRSALYSVLPHEWESRRNRLADDGQYDGSTGDGNRGHGNDNDLYDEDGPGNSDGANGGN